MGFRFGLVVALATWMEAACVMSTVAQTPEPLSRDAFLGQVDRALASRVPARVAALADVERWRTAGHDDLERLTLWLPPAPLTRQRELSPNELVYEDGEGNSWRLRLRKDEDRKTWAVVVLDRPCPSLRGRRGRPWEDAPQPPAESSPTRPDIWTPLECYPLPR